MSQMTWTYVDDYGKSHKVGLFHGDHSGHLLIYCNSKIMFIDFNVLQNKKYSFFINDELCDIHVEKQKNSFAYGFEIDQKTETPRNTNRRKVERTNSIQMIFISIALLITIGLFVYIGMQIMA